MMVNSLSKIKLDKIALNKKFNTTLIGVNCFCWLFILNIFKNMTAVANADASFTPINQ